MRAPQAAWLGAIASIVLYPVFFPDAYRLGLGIVVGAMAAGTVGFVLLMGYAHQLALGQAAFCMVGGYSTALLVTRLAWDPLLTLVGGATLAAALAWAIGLPILRLSGFMLAMASLALQLIMLTLARELHITGQALGVSGVPKFSVLGVSLHDDRAYYGFVWVVVLAFVAAGINLERSRHGRALKALASSEVAAASVAIDTAKSKLQMFVLSAAMASVSGSLIVHYLRIMEPSVFDFTYSLNIITAVVVGGMSSVWGGVLGASIFVGVREGVRGMGGTYVETLFMAALTCAVLMLFPRGVAGVLAVTWRRRISQRDPTARAVRSPVHAPESMSSRSAPAEQTPLAAVEILEVCSASRAFGALRAVDDVSFRVGAGKITALIGPNGAGKTTLFNLVCGHEPLDAGRISLGGRDIGRMLPAGIAALGLARTFQTPRVFHGLSVLDNAKSGAHRHYTSGVLKAMIFTPTVRAEERAAEQLAMAALAQVKLQGLAARSPDELSFGQQRMLEIARALAMQPRLLLMDEPASGLNDAETEELARLILRIHRQGTTVLLIEHDLRLVMGLADWIVVLDRGRKIAEGPPDEVRRSDEVVRAYLGAER
jgi:branched-chain amino acid transport system permease protein